MAGFKDIQEDENIYSYLESFVSDIIDNSEKVSEREREANQRLKEKRFQMSDYEKLHPGKVIHKRGITIEDLMENIEGDVEPLNEERLINGVHHYSAKEIMKMISDQLYSDITDPSKYEAFSKDMVREHFNEYVQMIHHLIDMKPDEERQLSKRGILENEFVRDISRLPEKDKQKIRNFLPTEKEMMKKVGNYLNEYKIEEHFQRLAKKTFGSEFTIENPVDNLIYTDEANADFPRMELKSNVVYTTFSIEGAKNFARQLQQMRETLSERPWYYKFSGHYRAAKAAVVKAEKALVNKGVDEKLLDKFVNAKGAKAEDYFNRMMAKSAQALMDFEERNDLAIADLGLDLKNPYANPTPDETKETLDRVNAIDFDRIKIEDELNINPVTDTDEVTDSKRLYEEKATNDELFRLDKLDKELATKIDIEEEVDEEEIDFDEQEDVKDDEQIIKK